jgi:preprotein translocase subunit SecG
MRSRQRRLLILITLTVFIVLICVGLVLLQAWSAKDGASSLSR